MKSLTIIVSFCQYYFLKIHHVYFVDDLSYMLFSQVLSADGTQEVGKVSKKFSGLAKEYFTDADNFGVQCTSGLIL